VRVRAANKGGVKRLRNCYVVNKAATSGEQRVVFQPRQA
jgi:hypothetical protein